MVIPTLKTCYLEASEDIMTKFKSEALHIIRIKCWTASGSGNPPFLIPALRKIALLDLKTGLWEWYTGISVRSSYYIIKFQGRRNHDARKATTYWHPRICSLNLDVKVLKSELKRHSKNHTCIRKSWMNFEMVLWRGGSLH